jgi:homoserine/homoserine lactone efflux protein
MAVHVWLSFAAIALAVCVSPGPAVITVVSSALRGGWRASLAATAGVLIIDALFAGAAAAGLGALLLASPVLFGAVRWLGIAYLVYLGIRALASKGSALNASGGFAGERAFRLGLTTQLANPKVILFFGALLPQFVDPRRPVFVQFLILGITFIACDALVFTVYGALAHRARALLASPRAAGAASKVTGAAMLGAAARLAVN